MRLAEVLIDDATWEALGPERRGDLAVDVEALIAESRFDVGAHGLLRLLVTFDRERLVVGLSQLDGHIVVQTLVPLASLEPVMREYLACCRRLAAGPPGRDADDLEALDIGKRLIHDEGADRLARLCGLLHPDHQTARKLFSIVVALRHDAPNLRALD